MPSLYPLLSAFVPIWVLTAVGYLLARTGLLGEHAEDVLGRFVFHVAMPAALFGMLARTPLGSFANASMLAFAAGTVLASLLGVAVSRWVFGRRPADQAISAMASGYVNSANLGIPVAVQVLGDATFIAPVLLFQVLLVTPVILTTLEAGGAGAERAGRADGYAAAGGTRSAARPGADRARRMLLLPLRNPVILASGLGSAVSAAGWHLPQTLAHSCELLGGAGVPTALVVLGMSLHGRPAAVGAGLPAEVGASVLIKTLVQPLVAFAVGSLVLGLPAHQLLAVVVCSALPTAQNVFIYARQYELSTVLARDSVLYSTLLSMVTLSGAAWVLGSAPH
ncbi:AEC family transporter [Kitasatospora sp. NBC_00240]|uniref:AEC family transporter n=1 Tax=Kitasatospora sp. NBC_00240 TaxID=2903567 RepID=UPI0022523CFB|nr:AEC family transporter [Kitasatospora sp. NBC_00240]MCX5214206.1 AEC family transporter [Kitasatospora sp. NBC_00240]